MARHAREPYYEVTDAQLAAEVMVALGRNKAEQIARVILDALPVPEWQKYQSVTGSIAPPPAWPMRSPFGFQGVQ